MNNYVQPGETLSLIAPYDRLSGEGALIGSLFGVAVNDVLSGAEGEFKHNGVYLLGKTSAQAWTEGQKLYWDDSNKRVDSDGTVGPLIGVAARAAANPSATGYVKLNDAVPSTAEGPQGAVVALTDSTGLSGTHDDTLAATTVPADLTGGESPTEAEHNAALAVMRVMAQNESDLAQKVNELRAAMVSAGLIAP